MKKIWITNDHENENLVIWFQTKLPFDVFNIFLKLKFPFFSEKENNFISLVETSNKGTISI